MHSPRPSPLPVRAVIVTHQVGRCHIARGTPRQSVALATPPSGTGSPQTTVAVAVTHHEKCKWLLKVQCGHHAEVDRGNGIRMVAQECSPRLRGWPFASISYPSFNIHRGCVAPPTTGFSLLMRRIDRALTADFRLARTTARFPAQIGPDTPSDHCHKLKYRPQGFIDRTKLDGKRRRGSLKTWRNPARGGASLSEAEERGLHVCCRLASDC
jgi:hypothetical protein